MASDEEKADRDERDEDNNAAAEGSSSDEETSDEASESSSTESASTTADAGSDDDEEEQADDAPASAAKTAAKATAASAGAASAGARLAAAKAAKAAKKAAKKAKIAEEREAASGTQAREETPFEAPQPIDELKESNVGKAATRAAEWASSNRSTAYAAAAAVLLVLVGAIGWQLYSASSTQAAGAALAEAMEIEAATVRAADAEAEEGATEASADERTFATADERREAALTAYRRVVSEHGGTAAATWARLRAARLLLEHGDYEDARTEYQAALDTAGRDPLVAVRAYEGLGFTHEAEGHAEQAQEQFQQIESVADGDFRAIGQYHLIRLRLAAGEAMEARTALRELTDAIEADHGEDEEVRFPYVLAQAEVRLRELDPSSASSGGGESPLMLGGDGAEGIDPAQLQEILQRLQKQGAGGGGGSGGE